MDERDLVKAYEEMRELLQYFVDRVEEGTIRSKRTYSKYTRALEKYPAL